MTKAVGQCCLLKKNAISHATGVIVTPDLIRGPETPRKTLD
jgi:hypothetical protein